MTTTAVRPSTRRDPLLTGTRVLLGAFGGFQARRHRVLPVLRHRRAGRRSRGAPRLVGRDLVDRARRRLSSSPPSGWAGTGACGVNGLLLVEIAFSLVKLFVYDEPEAVGFMAVDLVIWVCWRSSPGRRRRAE